MKHVFNAPANCPVNYMPQGSVVTVIPESEWPVEDRLMKAVVKLVYGGPISKFGDPTLVVQEDGKQLIVPANYLTPLESNDV